MGVRALRQRPPDHATTAPQGTCVVERPSVDAARCHATQPILAASSKPVQAHSGGVLVAINIGAVVTDDPTRDRAWPIRHAHVAMYRANRVDGCAVAIIDNVVTSATMNAPGAQPCADA